MNFLQDSSLLSIPFTQNKASRAFFGNLVSPPLSSPNLPVPSRPSLHGKQSPPFPGWATAATPLPPGLAASPSHTLDKVAHFSGEFVAGVTYHGEGHSAGISGAGAGAPSAGCVSFLRHLFSLDPEAADDLAANLDLSPLDDEGEDEEGRCTRATGGSGGAEGAMPTRSAVEWRRIVKVPSRSQMNLRGEGGERGGGGMVGGTSGVRSGKGIPMPAEAAGGWQGDLMTSDDPSTVSGLLRIGKETEPFPCLPQLSPFPVAGAAPPSSPFSALGPLSGQTSTLQFPSAHESTATLAPTSVDASGGFIRSQTPGSGTGLYSGTGYGPFSGTAWTAASGSNGTMGAPRGTLYNAPRRSLSGGVGSYCSGEGGGACVATGGGVPHSGMSIVAGSSSQFHLPIVPTSPTAGGSGMDASSPPMSPPMSYGTLDRAPGSALGPVRESEEVIPPLISHQQPALPSQQQPRSSPPLPFTLGGGRGGSRGGTLERVILTGSSGAGMGPMAGSLISSFPREGERYSGAYIARSSNGRSTGGTSTATGMTEPPVPASAMQDEGVAKSADARPPSALRRFLPSWGEASRGDSGIKHGGGRSASNSRVGNVVHTSDSSNPHVTGSRASPESSIASAAPAIPIPSFFRASTPVMLDSRHCPIRSALSSTPSPVCKAPCNVSPM